MLEEYLRWMMLSLSSNQSSLYFVLVLYLNSQEECLIPPYEARKHAREAPAGPVPTIRMSVVVTEATEESVEDDAAGGAMSQRNRANL